MRTWLGFAFGIDTSGVNMVTCGVARSTCRTGPWGFGWLQSLQGHSRVIPPLLFFGYPRNLFTRQQEGVFKSTEELTWRDSWSTLVCARRTCRSVICRAVPWHTPHPGQPPFALDPLLSASCCTWRKHIGRAIRPSLRVCFDTKGFCRKTNWSFKSWIWHLVLVLENILRLLYVQSCPHTYPFTALESFWVPRRNNFAISPIAVVHGGCRLRGLWELPEKTTTVLCPSDRLIFLPPPPLEKDKFEDCISKINNNEHFHETELRSAERSLYLNLFPGSMASEPEVFSKPKAKAKPKAKRRTRRGRGGSKRNDTDVPPRDDPHGPDEDDQSDESEPLTARNDDNQPNLHPEVGLQMGGHIANVVVLHPSGSTWIRLNEWNFLQASVDRSACSFFSWQQLSRAPAKSACSTASFWSILYICPSCFARLPLCLVVILGLSGPMTRWRVSVAVFAS